MSEKKPEFIIEEPQLIEVDFSKDKKRIPTKKRKSEDEKERDERQKWNNAT